MGKLNTIKEYMKSLKTYAIGTRDELKATNGEHLDVFFTTQYLSSMYALITPVLATELEMPNLCLIAGLYLADTFQRVWMGKRIMDDTNPGIIGTIRDPKNWKVKNKLENLVIT